MNFFSSRSFCIHWDIFINFPPLGLDLDSALVDLEPFLFYVVLSFSFPVEECSSRVKDEAGDPLFQAHSSGPREAPGFKGVQVCEVTRVVHRRVVATQVPVAGSLILQVRGWCVT